MRHRRRHDRGPRRAGPSRPPQRRDRPEGPPKHAAAPPSGLLEGRIQHHGRFAFLLSETPGKEDLMLRGPSLRLAMDGDRVAARPLGAERGRRTGEIVRVLERARATVVGVLRRQTAGWFACPEEGDAHDAVAVLGFAGGLAPREGEVAVVRVTRWPTLQAAAGGTVEEYLGRPGQPRVRLSAVLRTRELPEAFPAEVLEEGRRFPDRVTPDLWRGRRELFGLPVFTIDGADAKDFDDAVSLEPLGGGWRLGVHIADVSSYVRPGTALDAEARRRATSVYLADRVVPMLPPKLSDHLCSLMPDVERLTLSCFLDLDGSGRVLRERFEETVIRSWRRFTYEEVSEVLSGKPPAGLDPRVLETLRRMGPLAQALTRERLRRGALDFTMPEHKVVVDAGGAPLRVEKRPRLDSHRLIEEFMLAANEATARTLKAAGAPLLHRIHESPDPAKLESLALELKKLGISAPKSLLASPARALQEILRRAVGHPLEETINFMAVRSLKQAVYSDGAEIHFGLASKAYTHFTSPIRRYPDLFNHRGIRELLRSDGRRPRRWAFADGVKVAQLATHCSERERVAVEAERQSIDILRAELLQRRIGSTFEGVVSRNMPAGMFVTLPETGASGLVRNASAPVGAKVRVRLERVDEGKGELDLCLAEPARHPRRRG